MLCASSFFLPLLSLLLHFNPSLLYSLKSCTVRFSLNEEDVEVLCINRDLTAVPDDIPRNALSLDLSSNQIGGINKTDFTGLSKLLYLKIRSNSIFYIEDGAFADLVELTELHAGYNALTNLTDNIFQGLSKLENLNLDNNRISYISPLAFQDLVSLVRVSLSANELQRISDIVPILQLPNVYELSATTNRFSSLDSDDMPFNKSSIRMLMLEANPFKKFNITRNIFPDLQSMSFCTYSHDFVWNVPDETFLKKLTSLLLCGIDVNCETYRVILQRTQSLEYLWLPDARNCFGKSLIDLACQIPAMTTLDVSNNDIIVLNDTSLQSCSEIIWLSLSNGVIHDMSQNSLKPLPKLQHLHLDYNFQVRVPSAIRGLSTLLVLSIYSNDIEELDCSDFHNLTRLQKLFLGDNRISKLRGCVFKDLKNLILLRLDGNPIFQVFDTFRVSLQNLQILTMTWNVLPGLEKKNFGSLFSLKYLDIRSSSDYDVESNSFESFVSLHTLVFSPVIIRQLMFKGLSKLTSLTVNLPVDENSLTYQVYDGPLFINVPTLRELFIRNSSFIVVSPNVLMGLQNLRLLSAENFFTGTIHPDTFTYTPQLTNLQVVRSKIMHLKPDLFQPIPNLQVLDLSENKLKSLDFLTHANLSALTWVKLSKNELTVINDTFFQSLAALRYLDLSGNPFTCDCSNMGFIQWVKSNNQTQVVNAYQYNCYFPPSKQGTKLLDFDVQSCWTEPSFFCFISSSCLVLLTLLTSFIYHFLRWQLAYSFHLFVAFLYDSRKRRKEGCHQYDAFISYNVQDEEWVLREMLPVLEGEQGWRLCLHHRDFQPGKAIIENITDAIYSSRKTICVISQQYLQSEWCSREIQMASFRLFDEKKDVLILLFLEDIPSHQLSPFYRMRKLVKRRSYLSWPQAAQHPGLFWQNVQRALQTGETPTETTNLLTASVAPDYGT